MKIMLFCREIELIKVDENVQILEPKLMGTARVTDNKLYFDGRDPFETLLHELQHFYYGRTGIYGMSTFELETTCNIFGTHVAQLMLENGDDIFARLKRFAGE